MTKLRKMLKKIKNKLSRLSRLTLFEERDITRPVRAWLCSVPRCGPVLMSALRRGTCAARPAPRSTRPPRSNVVEIHVASIKGKGRERGSLQRGSPSEKTEGPLLRHLRQNRGIHLYSCTHWLYQHALPEARAALDRARVGWQQQRLRPWR